ncbi:hypothetical protein [Sessilibacter corallicola]|uniref:hypothetical protein n=1 Tax=Sessilibacter corallicola TaxID=2904075 RepID=UPI001E2FFA25|nr:hypothetical protein [Sessilibacter corallicola]MCE2029269.1 hypothetical protein [Sessilibacter corallicola]
MSLGEKVKRDIELHPLDRDPAVLVETFERMKDLEKMLTRAADELQSWWNDQGDYGTEGYDVWMPEMRRLIRGDV